MLILEINDLKKYIGDRLLLDIRSLKIYSGDKIGLIGVNGAGKTTLLDIIAGKCDAQGYVRLTAEWGYITQLDAGDVAEYLSGGEKTIAKVSKVFETNTGFIMADEPTSSLSIRRIEELTKRLAAYKGAMLLISHDRALLNAVCNKIIEIENGRIKEYSGNYDFYKKEKELEEHQKILVYEKYVSEKEHLEDAIDNIKRKARSMTKTPKRMGNSEARLHRNSVREKAKKMDGTSKPLEARLEMLEEVKKPVTVLHTRLDIQEGSRFYAKIAVEAERVSKAFGSRVLFRDASFKIKNGSKTALIGENGTGKTTLLNMIMDGADGIKKAHGLRIAYFSQDLSILDINRTIYENVSEDSRFDQTRIRSVLSRMLFYRDDVFKKVDVLSGGERVKVSMAKLFCRDVNMLILDEPNNYLDIYSLDALEGLIRDYEGTLLIATHDKSLISLADSLLVIDNGNIITFDGNYDEYLIMKNRGRAARGTERTNELLLLESRLAGLAGKLGTAADNEDKELLNAEYRRLAAEIRELKGQK